VDGERSRALVLGGGGVAGIAWEIGVLRGLEEAGVDVHGWRLVVGTSAGSVVGARILADPDLERWFSHETRAVTDAEDQLISALAGRAGGAALRLSRRRPLRWMGPAWITWLSLEAMVRQRARPRALASTAPLVLALGVHRIAGPSRSLSRIGAVARAARTPGESAFLRVIAEVIAPAVDWPAGLVVTAVDAVDGSAVALGADSGVPLARAVAASSAVPILFPVVRALDRRWMDGGMLSATHAPLAAGADEILVLCPLAWSGLDAEIRSLRDRGRRVAVVTPGTAGAAVLGFGAGLLDPIRRPAAAIAGRLDGLAAAAGVSTALGGAAPAPQDSAIPAA